MAHLDYLRSSLHLGADEFAARALRFRPLFERHCPHLVEEIGGLAEGAEIEISDALAVNIRGALGILPGEGCTSFVISGAGSASGDVLIGQTSDTLPNVIDFGYVLELQPENKPEVLMWTFGGMIGYHGLNSAGVAQFANDLGDGGPPARFGLPHYPLKRMILEGTSLSDSMERFKSTPLASNGNYVLCDGDGAILDVEATTSGPELIEAGGAGYIAHANHFLAPRYATASNHRQSVADSFSRQQRIDSLIRERYGTITVDDLKEILRDDDDHPTAICRHSQSTNLDDGFELAGRTVAALIAEPANGKLHVTRGNPCENSFTCYSLDA